MGDRAAWHEELWPGEEQEEGTFDAAIINIMSTIDAQIKGWQQGLEKEEEEKTVELYEAVQNDILYGNFMLKVRKSNTDPPIMVSYKCPRFLTDKQVEEETNAGSHFEFAFGPDCVNEGASGTLEMGTGTFSNGNGKKSSNGSSVRKRLSFSGDIFELQTRAFLWQRIREVQRNLAVCTWFLFFLVFGQWMCASCIIGLVSQQWKGGDRMLALSGTVSGGVMIAGSFIGVLGGLQQDEFPVRLFLSSTYFVIAWLVSLIYIQYNFWQEIVNQCIPSQKNMVASENVKCAERQTEISFAVLFCVLGLAATFLANFLCQAIIDHLNDLCKLNDNAIFVRYFTYRFTIIREKLMKLTGTRQMFGDEVVQVMSEAGPQSKLAVGMLGTYSDISPAAVIASGIQDFKFTKDKCSILDARKIQLNPELVPCFRPSQFLQNVNPPAGVSLDIDPKGGPDPWFAVPDQSIKTDAKAEMQGIKPPVGAPQGV